MDSPQYGRLPPVRVNYENNDPYPLDELEEVRWTLGNPRSPGAIVLEKSPSGGGIETGDGRVEVVLDPIDTAALDPQQYREELAISKRSRNDDYDLNRAFPRGSGPKTALVQALWEAVRGDDAVIDLHRSIDIYPDSNSQAVFSSEPGRRKGQRRACAVQRSLHGSEPLRAAVQV